MRRMSKKETPLTRRYWDSVGGALIEEFPVVCRGAGNAQRLLDGVIVLGEPKAIVKPDDVDIKGKDVIVIQTKASRLGMSLIGQAIISRKLIEAFQPRSARSIAVCTKGNSVLEALLTEYGIELVVFPC
jgi:hypothetical protein